MVGRMVFGGMVCERVSHLETGSVDRTGRGRFTNRPYGHRARPRYRRKRISGTVTNRPYG